jgi:glycerophosphoryl diester phosphodiesterase
VGLAVAVAVVLVMFFVGLSLKNRPPGPSSSATVVATARPNERAFPRQLRNQVLVIAHRGDATQAPEDTVASINAAFALGADMVEIDVHFSRDGVPVVIHDETLERTTNGKGPVSQMTLAQLKSLDAGSSFLRKFAGERIPTLAEALQAAKGKGPLLLDLKVEGLGRAVADVLRQLGLPDSSVAIGAWTDSQTKDFVTHVPGAQILLSTGQGLPKWDEEYFRRVRARGSTAFELHIDVVNEAFIAEAHKHGMPVYVFTINDEPTLRSLIAMGVDGIETDNPALLMLLLVRELSRP